MVSPARHGASPAALRGFKPKEFGGQGNNLNPSDGTAPAGHTMVIFSDNSNHAPELTSEDFSVRQLIDPER